MSTSPPVPVVVVGGVDNESCRGGDADGVEDRNSGGGAVAASARARYLMIKHRI